MAAVEVLAFSGFESKTVVRALAALKADLKAWEDGLN